MNDPLEEFRLPLSNQLFENRPIFVRAMEKFKECMPLVPTLRKEGVAVEKELAKLQSQAHKFPYVHRELAAVRCYLHNAVWDCQRNWFGSHRGITNYATLLREIERWRYEYSEKVCFVTFNYDTMLEEAMAQVLNFQFQDILGYVSRRDYVLVKLHGSVNWVLELEVTPYPIDYDYVVMPEHVHLLFSEPERGDPSVVLAALKQSFARRLLQNLRGRINQDCALWSTPVVEGHVWQRRFYGFVVFTDKKRIEKLRYMHRNPVVRGLVDEPQQWAWSSFRHYANDEPGRVLMNETRRAELTIRKIS